MTCEICGTETGDHDKPIHRLADRVDEIAWRILPTKVTDENDVAYLRDVMRNDRIALTSVMKERDELRAKHAAAEKERVEATQRAQALKARAVQAERDRCAATIQAWWGDGSDEDIHDLLGAIRSGKAAP